MRTTVLLIVIVASLMAPAFEALAAPYIGANLQVNSPTGKFSQTDIVDKDGGAKTGLGGELDLGLTSDMGSIYAGYRFGKHNADAKYTPPGGTPANVSGDWNISRAVIGLRWHILGNTTMPITPTLGGGITIGKTKASVSGDVNGTNYETDKTSKNSVGWFAEIGGLLAPPGPLSVIADIQYHSFDADFQSQLYNGKVNVAFFTFQAGLRYSISPMTL